MALHRLRRRIQTWEEYKDCILKFANTISGRSVVKRELGVEVNLPPDDGVRGFGAHVAPKKIRLGVMRRGGGPRLVAKGLQPHRIERYGCGHDVLYAQRAAFHKVIQAMSDFR